MIFLLIKIINTTSEVCEEDSFFLCHHFAKLYLKQQFLIVRELPKKASVWGSASSSFLQPTMYACSRDQRRCSIGNPNVSTVLRLRPRLQCTNTRPPGRKASAMNREVSRRVYRRSCCAPSLSRVAEYNVKHSRKHQRFRLWH